MTQIQRFSLHDGPGIRTTVFLKGCPLDCWWCHNAETRRSSPEIWVVRSRCVRCGSCVEACPTENASLSREEEDPGRCLHCGACVEACPVGARQNVGSRMTAEAVVAEVLKDRVFHEESQGGMTLSGGEPLLQPEFAEAVLRASRAAGCSTALDTCGFAEEAVLLRVASHADLVLYDLKVLDRVKHEEYTGVPNDRILSNLEALTRQHDRVWLRIPIIPGINDAPEDLEAMARFAAKLRLQQVNLLPYHRAGMQKRQRLGEADRLPNLEPPLPEQLEAARACFCAHGLPTRTGG